jgi:hypothetical protein
MNSFTQRYIHPYIWIVMGSLLIGAADLMILISYSWNGEIEC